MSLTFVSASSQRANYAGMPAGSWSMAAWVRKNNTTANQSLFGIGSGGSNGAQAYVDNTSGQLRLLYNGGSATGNAGNIGTAWAYVLITFNSATGDLTVKRLAEADSSFVASVNRASSVNTGWASLVIASNRHSSSVLAADETIAFLKIWSVVISDADALTEREYRNIQTNTGSIWAHYKFLTGATATDSSANARNLTLTGSPAFTSSEPTSILGDDPGGGLVTLVVADATHGHAADSPDLTQQYALVVADALHGHAADTPTLTQANVLAVADALHALLSDSPALMQANVLAVADALHALSSESPALEQANTLAVADALHALASEVPALTQAHLLGVAEALHAHAVDNLELASGDILDVADSLHAHAAEVPALTQANTIAPHDATHAHTAESPALTQGNVLGVDDALHVQLADVVTLDMGGYEIILLGSARGIHLNAEARGVFSLPGVRAAIAQAAARTMSRQPVVSGAIGTPRVRQLDG